MTELCCPLIGIRQISGTRQCIRHLGMSGVILSGIGKSDDRIMLPTNRCMANIGH